MISLSSRRAHATNGLSRLSPAMMAPQPSASAIDTGRNISEPIAVRLTYGMNAILGSLRRAAHHNLDHDLVDVLAGPDAQRRREVGKPVKQLVGELVVAPRPRSSAVRCSRIEGIVGSVSDVVE